MLRLLIVSGKRALVNARRRAPRPWCGVFAAVVVSLMVVYGCGGGGSSSTNPPGPSKSFTLGAKLPSKQEVDSRPQGITVFGSGQGDKLPTSVDLTRDRALPTPGNQGQLGSCVAWAVGYDLMTYTTATTNQWDGSTADHQGSPADLYAKLLQAQNGSCGDGTKPEDAMRMLLEYGVQTMSQVPYTDTGCATASTSGTFGIKGYHVLKPDDPVALKRQLASGNIVAFGAKVYDDLGNWGVGPNRRGVYKGSGTVIGGHAMDLVGYDDTRNAWRVMNSWGSDWGDNGFFWMDYTTFSNTASIALIADAGTTNNVPPPNPNSAPSFQSLQAGQYFDYYYGLAYLVMTFQLSEPIFVTQVTLTYQNGGVVASVPAKQWVYASYFWSAIAYPNYFPDGAYTLTFYGITRGGQQVTLSQTAQLSGRATASQSLPGMKATGRAALPPMPANMKPASLRPGMELIMNGQKVTLRPR